MKYSVGRGRSETVTLSVARAGGAHLIRGSLMLGCACSSCKTRMTAGTTKTAAMMRMMSNTNPIRQPRSVSPRRTICRVGSDGETCGGGGRGTAIFGGVVVVGGRRGAGTGVRAIGGGCTLAFGDCDDCCGGAWVVPRFVWGACGLTLAGFSADGFGSGTGGCASPRSASADFVRARS